jgi:hypothetical protein
MTFKKGWKKEREAKKALKEEQELNAEIQEQKKIPPPVLPRNDEVLGRAYSQGFQDGVNAASRSVLEALGFKLTPVGEAPRHAEQSPVSTANEEKTRASSPTDTSSPPSSPLCSFCGHTREMHEPIQASTCFDHDCKCKGWTDKSPIKIGNLTIRR